MSLFTYGGGHNKAICSLFQPSDLVLGPHLQRVRRCALYLSKCAMRSLLSYLVNGNSLERIQQYIDIDHEPVIKDGGQPPAYWPASGDLSVENLSARYSRVCLLKINYFWCADDNSGWA